MKSKNLEMPLKHSMKKILKNFQKHMINIRLLKISIKPWRQTVVKDIEHHNKVINKINADKTKSLADKMSQVKDTNVGSLTLSPTPNNSINHRTKRI